MSSAELQTFMAVLHSPSVMEPLREELGLPEGTPIDASATLAEDLPGLRAGLRRLAAACPPPVEHWSGEATGDR